MEYGLFPADTYIVKNATMLNDSDRLTLFKLYEPVIGATAINLYFTFWSDLDSASIVSVDNNHHNLMARMQIKLEDILEAREKLEAIGLIKTYFKEGSVNNYIYELYSPLDPKEFLDNPILSTTLESNVGKKEYKRILKSFIIPEVETGGYKEITASFSSVFDVASSTQDLNGNIKSVRKLELLVDSKVDLNGVLSSIPSEILNHRSVSNEIKSLIYKLAYIYNLKEEELIELIRNSINEKKIIDKDILRKNCHSYYIFENKDATPSLVYKKQPDYLRTSVSDNSKRSKMIYTFETETPYDFLLGKNKGVKPSKSDLNLLETLMVDYDLNPGVVNVLIDYVLKINDNKLTKNFVLTIASQWKRSNIKTVEEAMKICKKENSSKKKVSKASIKVEKKPEWFDKNIEEETASDEEIAELERKLNEVIGE